MPRLESDTVVPSWRERLPRYIADHELLRRIGQGSYGGVWLARNNVTQVYRAIKIVWRESFPNPRPFERELEAIRRFEPISRSHEGFVQILQVGELEDAFYYIMELGDDEKLGPEIDPSTYRPRTLGQYRSQALPLEECVEVGIALATALEVLHRANLIHRDIKPSNVIFVNGKAKLADIGLVSHVDEARSFVGTTGFIPPEGPVNPLSDIYSLGKLLYEISTGKDRLQFPELPEDVSSESTLLLELNQIILKACQNNPSRRHSSALALRKELEILQTGKSIKRLRHLERRLRIASFTLIFLVVGAVIGIAIWSHLQRLERLAAEEHQRRLGTFLAKGTELMKAGDFAAALPHFVQAASGDITNSHTHKLRLGALVASMIKPINILTSPPRKTLLVQSNILVVGEQDAVLLDSQTGRVIKMVPITEPFVAGTPDFLRFAAAEGKQVRSLESPSGKITEHQFNDEITGIELDPAAPGFAVTFNSSNVVLVGESGRRVFTHPQIIFRTTYSPRGTYFTCIGFDGQIFIRRTATGELLPLSPSHELIAYDAIFSPDESIVITSGFDRAVRAWDLKTGQQIGLDMLHGDAVERIALSPEGKILATGSYDRTVRLWDARTFRPIPQNHLLHQPDRVSQLQFASEDKLVVQAENGMNVVWDLTPDLPVPVKTKDLTIIPHKTIIQTDLLHLAARGNVVSGTAAGKPLQITLPSPVSIIAANPQQTILAIGTRDDGLSHHQVRLFTADGTPTGIGLPHRDGITFALFSHAGDRILTCGEDFVAMIWDVETGRQLAPPMKHMHQVHWAAFNHDDTWVITSSWDQTVVVWDSRYGEPIIPPLNFDHRLDYVHFDSGTIVAGDAVTQYELTLPMLQSDPGALLEKLIISPDLKQPTFSFTR